MLEHICSGIGPWSCNPWVCFDAEVEIVCRFAIFDFEAMKKVATHKNIWSGLA